HPGPRPGGPRRGVPWSSSSPPVHRKRSPLPRRRPSSSATRRSARCTCSGRWPARRTASAGPSSRRAGPIPLTWSAAAPRRSTACREPPTSLGTAFDALEAARREADTAHRTYLPTEHLMIGIALGKDAAARLLTAVGATPRALRDAVQELTTGDDQMTQMDSQNPE